MSSYTNKLLPLISTLLLSYMGTSVLYTITNQKEILIAIFLVLFLVVSSIKLFITEYVFPEEKKGKTIIERKKRDLDEDTILQLLDFISSIIITIMMFIFADIFTITINTIQFQWFEYIVLFELPLFFIITVIPKFE